jgi:hypoxanthine phosphoribosyltransferase
MTAKKIFVSADSLLNDSFTLGARVLASGFAPDMLIALWRGGTPVGAAIQELLVYCGVINQHFAVKTRHYAGIEQRHGKVLVEGLEPVLPHLRPGLKVLLVDDVFDTGLSLEALMGLLANQCAGLEIRTATPYFKPANNQTARQPDYFLHSTDEWIVFPHELDGLRVAEILAGKPELTALRTILPLTTDH